MWLLIVLMLLVYYLSRSSREVFDPNAVTMVPSALEHNATVIKTAFETVKRTYPANLTGFEVYKQILKANNITNTRVMDLPFLIKLEELHNVGRLSVTAVFDLLRHLQ